MGIQEAFYSADGAPGLAISQFFLGVTPVDEAKFNSLADFVAMQETDYASRGAVDPQLAGYEALGRGFAGDPAFASSLELGTDATSFFSTTYEEVFGRAGGADQVQHFVNQENYFKGIYTAAGLSDADAAAQARGAALGQLIGHAVQDESTPYGQGVANFYADASDGTVAYGQSLFVPPAGPVEVDTLDPNFATFDTIELGSSKFVNATAGDDGSGGLHFGDGTTPGTGMIVASEIDFDGVTVMASLRPRQTDGNVYQAKETFVSDNTITANYIAAAGTQQIATGSFADNATRTGQALSFQFGSEGASFAELYEAGYTAHIAFDLDASAGIDYVGAEYIGAVQSDGTLDFENTGTGPNITDNGGNTFVAGNSTLYGFRTGGLQNADDGNQFTDHFYWMKDGVEVVGVVMNVTLDTSNVSWLHEY